MDESRENRKERARLFRAISRMDEKEYETGEDEPLCEGFIVSSLSETELVMEVAGANDWDSDTLQTKSGYVLYLYNGARELFRAFVCYRGMTPQEDKVQLHLEIISPVEKLQRRMHLRVACHSKLSCQAITRDALKAWQQERQERDSTVFFQSPEDSMVDLSGGGMRFTTKKFIGRGEYLIVYIELHGHDDSLRLELAGQVVSITPFRHEKGKYDIHMKYLYLSEKDREKIIRFVFQLERDGIKVR